MNPASRSLAPAIGCALYISPPQSTGSDKPRQRRIACHVPVPRSRCARAATACGLLRCRRARRASSGRRRTVLTLSNLATRSARLTNRGSTAPTSAKRRATTAAAVSFLAILVSGGTLAVVPTADAALEDLPKRLDAGDALRARGSAGRLHGCLCERRLPRST